MPTRILREGIITSERVNKLTLEAELFYRRLMSVADDHGRYFAHPSILRANCYPLRLDQISEADIRTYLSECEAAGLLTIYNSGKHIQVTDFRQQTRTPSKFPEPTENTTLIKTTSENNPLRSLVGGGGVVEDEGGGVSGAGGNHDVEMPPGFPADEQAARRIAEVAGLPQDFAESVWVKASGRGGRDARDVPIRSFVHHLKVEWKYQQERVAKEKHHATNQPNRRPSVDRNEGTLNAGTSAQYGKLATMGKLPVPRGPAT